MGSLTSKAVNLVLMSVMALSAIPVHAAESAQSAEPALIPWPKSLRQPGGKVRLADHFSIVVADGSLMPLGQVFASEIFMLTGQCPEVRSAPASAGGILLKIDPQLKGLAQKLDVTPEGITVAGGSYGGVAMASVTLLQAMQIRSGEIAVPAMSMSDAPGSVYCGLMLDVARQWQPADSVKPLIEMCRMYKIRYLHLHLTDNQLFTFPSTAFPQFQTEQHYTLVELKDLVAYADARGVTLVPEIEMPGHSRLDSVMPELFGALDGSGKPAALGVLNVTNDAIYPALDTLIGEVCDVFKSSPYFHMGADETNWSDFNSNPSIQAYMLRNHATTDQLFAGFINRIDAMIKQHGKRTIVWEGFGQGLPVNKDVIVEAWHGSSHAPSALLSEGYDILNTPWIPSVYSSVRENYEWNIWRLNLSEAGNSQQFAPMPQVLGGEMVLWEKGPADSIPMLRTKAPARQERVYAPTQNRSFDDFASRLAGTDALVGKLLYPVDIQVTGWLNEDEANFSDPVTVKMVTSIEGAAIHYTINGAEPSADSPAYTSPISLTSAQAEQVYLQDYYGRRIHIEARAFEAAGKAIGATTILDLRNDPPRLRYALYRPAPGQKQFVRMPDVESLNPFETGVLGRIGSSSNINRGPDPIALLATAQFNAEGNGQYSFNLIADPAGELMFDGKVICSVTPDSGLKQATGTVFLTKGPHVMKVLFYSNDGHVKLDVPIETFPVRTKHHWEDQGLYEWLEPLDMTSKQ
jgi:hexosaminidase